METESSHALQKKILNTKVSTISTFWTEQRNLQSYVKVCILVNLLLHSKQVNKAHKNSACELFIFFLYYYLYQLPGCLKTNFEPLMRR